MCECECEWLWNNEIYFLVLLPLYGDNKAAVIAIVRHEKIPHRNTNRQIHKICEIKQLTELNDVVLYSSHPILCFVFISSRKVVNTRKKTFFLRNPRIELDESKFINDTTVILYYYLLLLLLPLLSLLLSIVYACVSERPRMYSNTRSASLS